ncbi:hypothetical protein CEXT_615631, partial [Caerostris extrusa]
RGKSSFMPDIGRENEGGGGKSKKGWSNAAGSDDDKTRTKYLKQSEAFKNPRSEVPTELVVLRDQGFDMRREKKPALKVSEEETCASKIIPEIFVSISELKSRGGH